MYSDHLNAVSFLRDALIHAFLPQSWSSLPSLASYRWALSILRSFPFSSPPFVSHEHAHTTNTSASDPPSQANNFVDRLASDARIRAFGFLPVPLPTFLWTNSHPISHPILSLTLTFLLSFIAAFAPSLRILL
jgi:hypothetical protein